MPEDSGSKTIDALPTGLVERITQEQDLLNRFHFEVSAGNTLVQDAQIICLADPNHGAPDHSSFGSLIKQIARPEDVILIESDDIERNVNEHSLPRNVETKTWEDLEQFRLAHLILDRYKLIGVKIGEINILRSLDFLRNMQQKLAREMEMLDHPELLGDVDFISEDQSQTKYSRKIERLQAARGVLKQKMDSVVLNSRNIGLTAAINETLGRQEDRRIFIIAGQAHLVEQSQEVIASLGAHPYVILSPINVPSELTEQAKNDFKPVTPEERARIKNLWLAARQANS